MQSLVEVKKQEHQESFNLQDNIWLMLNQITFDLRSFSKQLTRNDFDADDLYQETVFRIINKADKYTFGTNFKAWAITIMRNVFINNYRRKKRFKTIIDQTPDDHFVKKSSSNIENDGESHMAYKELLKMISKLPENFKRPFWMAYKGYPYKEISEMLNVPMGTIKCRIFFARKTLQSMIGTTAI